MAKVTFQVVSKPIEQRFIDAACIYYEVERTYFFKSADNVKLNSLAVQRRNILYYLIKNNTTYTWREIARLFGFSTHEKVIEGVNTIEAHKNVYKNVNNEINQILFIADKLDAAFIERDIVLINNKLVLETE